MTLIPFVEECQDRWQVVFCYINRVMGTANGAVLTKPMIDKPEMPENASSAFLYRFTNIWRESGQQLVDRIAKTVRITLQAREVVPGSFSIVRLMPLRNAMCQ